MQLDAGCYKVHANNTIFLFCFVFLAPTWRHLFQFSPRLKVYPFLAILIITLVFKRQNSPQGNTTTCRLLQTTPGLVLFPHTHLSMSCCSDLGLTAGLGREDSLAGHQWWKNFSLRIKVCHLSQASPDSWTKMPWLPQILSTSKSGND